MSDYIQIKLPEDVITVILPKLQSNGVAYTVAGSTRITEQINTRVTRGGNTRVTRDWSITTYPELTLIKLPDGVVNVILAGDGHRKRTDSLRAL